MAGLRVEVLVVRTERWVEGTQWQGAGVVGKGEDVG